MDIQTFSCRDLDSPPLLLTGCRQLHVWLFSMQDYDLLEKQASCLSGDEQKRADKCVQEPDRKRYIIGRTALRRLLGQYLHSSPETFAFQTGLHGKPYLNGGSIDSGHSGTLSRPLPIHFNISHSGDMIALAFCLDSPVGIDIEKIRDSSYMAGIIRRFFHPSERLLFSRLNEIQKKESFFRHWTVREAFLKALGTGFSVSPDSFCVEAARTQGNPHPKTASPDEGLYLITQSREDYTSWRVQSVPAPDGYMCSAAYLA